MDIIKIIKVFLYILIFLQSYIVIEIYIEPENQALKVRVFSTSLHKLC